MEITHVNKKKITYVSGYKITFFDVIDGPNGSGHGVY
jgi:hypothetical protein